MLTTTALISVCLTHSIHAQINCKQGTPKQSFHTGFLTFLLGYSIAAPAVVAFALSSNLDKLDEPYLNETIMSTRSYYSAYNITPTKQIVELIYINDGLLLPYFDEEHGAKAGWTRYKPSAQNEKKRSELLLQSQVLSDTKNDIRNLVNSNLILLLLKLGIVLLTLLMATCIQKILRKNKV